MTIWCGKWQLVASLGQLLFQAQGHHNVGSHLFSQQFYCQPIVSTKKIRTLRLRNTAEKSRSVCLVLPTNIAPTLLHSHYSRIESKKGP